ncbi:MAG: caspase family protein [Bacteroidales bacterium]|nr:caspase family protein [Bacteroidales bacterium]
MKNKKHPYQLMILSFSFLMTVSSYSQNTEQLIISSDGKYCKAGITGYQQKTDTLIISLAAEWINDKFQPVADDESVIVLYSDKAIVSPQSTIKSISFAGRNYIAFNRTYQLKYLIEKGSDIREYSFQFDFETAKNLKEIRSSRTDLLVIKNPKKLEYAARINPEKLVTIKKTPPGIKILTPQPDSYNNIVIKESTVDVIGYANDESGINLVLVNSEDARLYPDGKFISNVKLVPGQNTIKIIAIDNDGAITEDKLTVECLSYALSAKLLETGKYYGLLIAVENYEDSKITDLSHAIDDAMTFYNTLTKYYTFDTKDVKLLTNPKFEDIVIELDKLTKIITEKDNLLLYFAGHGIWSEQTNVGFWLPSDAKESNTANWFRNSTMRDYIGSIKSKHTLLIADACFSGSIFKSRKAFTNAPVAIEKVYELTSRKAMTSGSLSEVPDRSVFLEYLIKRLTENNKPFLSSEELFYSLKTAVINNSPNIPQFGEILNTGDEGGDFIFIRKDADEPNE